VATLIAILDPQIVVLGGGLMQAADLFLEPVRRMALCWTQPVAASKVRIETTALGEDAGLLGAARLAWLQADKAGIVEQDAAAKMRGIPTSKTGE